MKDRISELRRKLPASCTIVDGGSVEESAIGEASVAAVVPIMLVLMVTLLMIQMQPSP